MLNQYGGTDVFVIPIQSKVTVLLLINAHTMPLLAVINSNSEGQGETSCNTMFNLGYIIY